MAESQQIDELRHRIEAKRLKLQAALEEKKADAAGASHDAKQAVQDRPAEIVGAEPMFTRRRGEYLRQRDAVRLERCHGGNDDHQHPCQQNGGGQVPHSPSRMRGSTYAAS